MDGEMDKGTDYCDRIKAKSNIAIFASQDEEATRCVR